MQIAPRSYQGHKAPKLETPNTVERAQALQLRLAELRAERAEDRENLTWDRVGGDD